MRKSCPACNTASKKYWKVMKDKSKCLRCGYEWRKDYKQARLKR